MSDKTPVYLSKEYRNSLGRLLDLTDAQKSKIKKRLKREIDHWKDDTSGLQQKLQRWNDLLEGAVEETDYPFVGAANIHVPLVAIYCKVYHSIERRSILGSDLIWYMETLDDNLRDYLPDVEEAINYKARNEWNIAQALSDVFWTTNRDGLGIMQVSYVEEYEEGVHDFVLVSNDEEFMQEFPTPEDLGMTPEDWAAFRQAVAQTATEENPVEIPITYDKEIYRGPYGEVVELADFTIFPATAKDIGIQYARGYGKRFYLRKGVIKKKSREGVWYEDAVTRLFEKSSTGSEVSDYKRAGEEATGLARSGKSDDFEFFEEVYRMELESGEKETKMLLVYSREHDELMAAIEYPYRVDFYALFRINSRPNRLIGSSIPADLEDTNEEIDTLHNQRINSRKISEVPSFKGKKGAKSDFDSATEDNLWYPGVIFWLDDPEAFEQFKVQPVDLRSSLEEESNDLRISSLHMGVEPFLFSGSPTNQNPDAPGNKTALLIQQSNLRMDDPITELRSGVERVGEICLSHEYQFGDPIVSFQSTDPQTGQVATKNLPKRLLRKGIKVCMHGVTVALNPEAEFTKWMSYYQALVPDPIVGQRNQSRWEILMRALRAGRVQGRDKILPTLQQLQQEEAQMRAQAILMASQQQDQLKAQGVQANAQASTDLAAQQDQAQKTQELNNIKHAQAKEGLKIKGANLGLQKMGIAQKALAMTNGNGAAKP